MSFRIAGLYLLLVSSALRGDSLESILSRMDAAAPGFHGAAADVTMVTYESVLDDKTTEHGTLQMQRTSPKDIRAVLGFTGEASARTLFFQGKKLVMYYPKTDYYQDYDLGSDSQLLNQYLLLGFGSSGRDLSASYDITEGKSETIAGQNTTPLLLIPKSPSVKQNLSKIQLWIPADGANPVQQEFFQKTGDTRTVTYTNLKLNPAMQGALKFDLPKTAKKQK